MFRYLIFGLIIIATTLVAFGQSSGTHCPKLEIVGPAATVSPGDTVAVSLNVEQYDDEKLRYRWTVSAGSIESGQNTPSIIVRTGIENTGDIVANVQVEGLPRGCAVTSTLTATIQGNCMIPRAIVEYGHVSPRYELQQIKAAVEEWRKRGASDRIVIALHSNNARDHKIVDNRVKIISKHLADLGVSKDNFAIVTPRIYVSSWKRLTVFMAYPDMSLRFVP